MAAFASFNDAAYAEEGEVEQSPSGIDVEAVKLRKSEIDALKIKLSEAKTPEDRVAALSAFRALQEARRRELEADNSEDQKPSPLGKRNEVARGVPLDEKLRKRIEAIEELKSAIEQARVAQGEEKQRLLAQISEKHEKLLQLQSVEAGEAKAISSARRLSGTIEKGLTPEMQAIESKDEERRREIEQLKAALEQADPQAKARLLDEWRQKRERDLKELASKTQRGSTEGNQP